MGGFPGMRSSSGMHSRFDDDDDDDMGGAHSFFGGMPGGMPNGSSRGRRPTSPASAPAGPSEITRPLKVSLEDLYSGSTKRLKVGRKLLNGTTEDKVLEIQVYPGWKSGTKIRFPKAGNEQLSGEAQDLVFVVEEKPHDRFKREGNDLVVSVSVPLVDALTGGGDTKKVIEHLDGRKLQVTLPNGIIKPGSTITIPGEGMPIRKEGSTKKKGDLIVKWDVVFPDRLTSSQKEGIRKILS
jgi:DnaJ homolog subfamily B member 4